MKPRLLDLFCGGGGAARGYQLAGFHVTGVDIAPQPHYVGDEFHQADALTWLDDCRFGSTFAAIHASPPCQPYSSTASLHNTTYPRLIDEVRALLRRSRAKYVIENVVGAPLTDYVTLCGSSFGLGVRRHRRFETNWIVWNPPRCDHASQPEPVDVTGGGPTKPGRIRTGGGISRKPRTVAEASAAMGIDWMTRAELNEAIPPAYTEFIGQQLLSYLAAEPPSSKPASAVAP